MALADMEKYLDALYPQVNEKARQISCNRLRSQISAKSYALDITLLGRTGQGKNLSGFFGILEERTL